MPPPPCSLLHHHHPPPPPSPQIKAMTANSEDLGFPKANIVSKMEDAVFKF